MLEVVLDCTTNNCIYDPTGPQGQWFQHRWGPRSYPDGSLDINQAIPHAITTESVKVDCVYGDPMCWPPLKDFVQHVEKQILICTNANISDTKLWESVAKDHVSFLISVDGINEQCGKVFLGADWDTILKNIRYLGNKCTVEFRVYQHNCYQIAELVELSKKYQFEISLITACCNDLFGVAVIDQDCTWLYDVIPVDTTGKSIVQIIDEYGNLSPELDKHQWSYMSLRTFLPIQKHRGLLDKPLITKLNYMPDRQDRFLSEYNRIDGKFVSPNNQLFYSAKIYATYMHLLADDWKFTNEYMKEHKTNHFVQELAFFARKLQEDYT